MYRQQISQKASPSPRSTSKSKAAPIPSSGSSYESLSSVVQRAQQDPESVSKDERQQLESAIGTRSTQKILTGKQNSWAPEFKGISEQLWSDAGQVGEPIQAKLTIGEVGDKYEQEADRVAKNVVQRINQPEALSPKQGETLQRQELPEDEELQMKPLAERREAIYGGQASKDLESSINSAGGGGQPLDRGLQQSMGQAMGADFSRVKVHTGAQADQLNQSIQAKAFTMGQDVFFRQGAYEPGSQRGQELIAHELTHVVQQSGGTLQRSSQVHRELQHLNTNKTSALEGDRPLQEIGEINSELQPEMIQRKGEFKAQYQKNPELAKAAVKADYADYADYQNIFELKLGVGLYKNKNAMDGADIMLAKMRAAMEAAGFADNDINQAFAIKKGEELGGVLLADVSQAILSGNLREKMGMVYQARSAITQALDVLRKQDAPKIPLGEEILSEEMSQSIDKLKLEPSVAILKRRDSIQNQDRQANKALKQKLITGEYLKDLGVPLSEREEKASQEQEINGKKDRRFIPGSEYYIVPPKPKMKEQEQLRRVVSGLSGSTDMYFHIAKHLNMDESERKLLRLAALGQMIVNNDHSYHEIMHVARTQGGLTDYPDELPIGYTTLSPLSEDEIINTTTLEDFPGDKQAKDSMVEFATTKEDITKVGGEAAKGSHKYSAILAKVDEYHQNPKIKTLEEIKRLVDVWLNAKKPGILASKNTKTQWEKSTRRQKLIELKNEADRLLKRESEYLKLDFDSAKQYILDQLVNAPEDKQLSIQKKMENFIDTYIKKITQDSSLGKKLDKVKAQEFKQKLEQKKEELNKIKILLTGTTDDWQSKDFRAKKSDLDLDLSNVDIPNLDITGKPVDISDPKGMYGKLDAPLKGDLKKALKQYVIDNRNIIEALGKDVSSYPVLTAGRKREAQDDARSQLYQRDIEDFTTNIDTSMVEALSPSSPIDNLLRQIEGKPMPQELEAINAYSEPGFYTMMNRILNKSRDKEFMSKVPREAKALVSLAISGLRKMKPYEGGTVYRGQPGLDSDYVKKELITKPKNERKKILESEFKHDLHYKQFISTSKRPYQAYSTQKGKWLAMEIQNVKTGVDISAIANTLYEREVLFPPNVTLKVKSVEDKFVNKVISDTGKETFDESNKYAEAPIADREGRVKVVYEEV
ncbi:hypothetical protein RIVM261_034420 [Rivularia sp. IAM M-261]|nr:hypothetical protein RIVM261_034420 [Rivularia sp. IAM M-261]